MEIGTTCAIGDSFIGGMRVVWRCVDRSGPCRSCGGGCGCSLRGTGPSYPDNRMSP